MSIEERLETLEKTVNNMVRFQLSQTAINHTILKIFEEAGIMEISDELEKTMERGEELIKELQKTLDYSDRMNNSAPGGI